MSSPLLYYIRHGETEWNREKRLQGQRDIPINANGRRQARHSGAVLRELLARDGADPAQLDFVTSPLGRACETMQLLRTELGRDPQNYRLDARLTEISFGAWEGYTIEELRGRWPEAVAEREDRKWDFVPPQAESYAVMSLRVRDWYESLTRDTIAVAHAGTLRGLIAQLGIVSAAEAPFLDVAQDAVYVIRPGSMNRYGSPVCASTRT
jgi:probable phosphoglycerate mutase